MGSLSLIEEFKNYMNAPLCRLKIGKEYWDNVDMAENPYMVVGVVQKENGKFYAKCLHVDEFSGDECMVEVYEGNLSLRKE